jgi:general secretion pathway protein N
MRLSRWFLAFFCLLHWPGAIIASAGELESSAETLANPVAAQSLDQLSATLDRPLFSPTRRRPAPSPVTQAVAPSAPQQQPPPTLTLFGVAMDSEQARALIRTDRDKKMLRARIGDDIDGWKISQIEGQKVVLSLGERFVTLTLFDNDRMKAEAASKLPAETQQNAIYGGNRAQQTAEQQSGEQKRRRRSRE